MKPYPSSRRYRFLELLVRAAEYLFLPQLLMALNSVFKRGTRPLTQREVALARKIFHESIDYQKVRMDERSVLGCRRYRFAYVGFHYINSWGPLPDAVFVHEMVHVWQYQRFGAVYIPRALWAQTTKEGYDYCGIAAIRRANAENRSLLTFNYEQQGDIVADYFCLKNGVVPRWCAANPVYLPEFEKILTIFNQ